MAGHVETMARDRWASLVLTSALSHVDDTVLLLKIVLSVLMVRPFAPLSNSICTCSGGSRMTMVSTGGLIPLMSVDQKRAVCTPESLLSGIFHDTCQSVSGCSLSRWLLPQAKAGELLRDKCSGRIFLQLLSPDNPRYFTPALQAVLHPALASAPAAAEV